MIRPWATSASARGDRDFGGLFQVLQDRLGARKIGGCGIDLRRVRLVRYTLDLRRADKALRDLQLQFGRSIPAAGEDVEIFLRLGGEIGSGGGVALHLCQPVVEIEQQVARRAAYLPEAFGLRVAGLFGAVP